MKTREELQSENEALREELSRQKRAQSKDRDTTLSEQLLNLSTSLCFINKDFRIERVNDSFCELFEVEKEEIEGELCYSFLRGPLCKQSECVLMQILSGKDKVSYEMIKKRHNGQERSLMIHAKPFYDTTGALAGIVENITDITEHKEITQELESTKEFYHRLIGTTCEGFWSIDKDRKTVEVNLSLCTMMGYHAEEMIGRSPLDFVDDENQQIFTNHMQQINDSKHRIYEIALRHKDGYNIPVILSASTIFDTEGEVQGAFAFISDVSGLKKVEAELRESEQKFRTLAENMPTGIMMYQDFTWVYSNETASMISGYSNAELMKMKIWELVHPDFRERIKQLGEDRQTGKQVQPVTEFKIITKQGQEKWVATSGGTVTYRGKAAAIISVSDIDEQKNMEEQLRESIDKFKFLSKATFEGIIIHKMGTVIDCNDAFLKITGYAKHEVIGKRMLNYVPRIKDRAKVMRNIIKHVAKPYTVQVHRKDGTWMTVELEAQNVVHNGEVVRIAAVRDVTEREKAKQDLVNSEIKYRNLSEHSPTIIFSHDLNGRITYINRRGIDFLQMNPDHIIGMDVFDFLPLEQAYKQRQQLMKLLSDDFTNVNLELRYPTADGTKKILDLSASPIMNDGVISEVLIQLLDVTEKKKAEETLKINEARYRRAQEIGHVGNWEYNIHNDTFWASDEGKRIYGLDLDARELTAEEVESCIPDRIRVHQALVDLIEKNEPYDLEFEIIKKDSKKLRFVHSKALIECDSAGNPAKVSGVVTDITAIKQAEEDRERLLQEKELLLHEVHHRIKNNMATIESLLRLHQSGVKHEESRYALLDAGNRIKSMRVLYEKLFRSATFSDVQATDYLPSLIEEVVKVFPQKDSVTIQMDIDDFSLQAKSLFPLGIIINELITNAMKYAFSSREGNRLEFSAKRQSSVTQIIVKDNGIGLPEHFDTKETKGFGLQLVDLLAEQLGATLDVSSDRGARFCLQFDADR